MLTKNIFQIAHLVPRALLTLALKRPFIASYSLTNKCNNNCAYCDSNSFSTKESTTEEVLKNLKALKKIGIKIIAFTGGEPTLKKNLYLISKQAKKLGFITLLNSNGHRLNKKILKNIDILQLSLDGKKQYNDKTRGTRNYDKTIEILKLCKKENASTLLSCVLYQNRVEDLIHVSKIAKKYKAKLLFQPYVNWPHGKQNNKNNSKDLVKYVIKHKNKLNPVNYTSELKYYLNPKPIKCFAGRFSLRVEPNGQVYPCEKFINSKKNDTIKLTDKNLTKKLNDQTQNCAQCNCNTEIQKNLLLNLNVKTLIEYLLRV